MKKSIYFILAGIIISTSSCAQDSNVPDVVKTAFTQKFPGAKKVNWDMEDSDTWEAEFKMNSLEYSSNFSIKGDWLETEHEIKKSEIPSEIKALLEKDFSGFKIEESEISEKPDGKFYELAIEKGDEQWELVFDITGKLIDKKPLEEDDED